MEDQHKKLVKMMSGNFAMQIMLAPTISATKFKSLEEMSDEILAISLQFNNKMKEISRTRINELHGKKND